MASSKTRFSYLTKATIFGCPSLGGGNFDTMVALTVLSIEEDVGKVLCMLNDICFSCSDLTVEEM